MTHQYYHKQDKCKAESAKSQDCICWHDEGTGPYFDERFDQKKHWRTCNLEWRVKPESKEAP